MILPSRPENHPRPAPPRRAIDLSAALGPHPRRDLPELERFAPPPWDRLSPRWLEIEDPLPADHRARVIDEAVDQLDLTALFASPAGVGSKAHRPDLIPKIVRYEIQTGRHSPAQWFQDGHDRRCLQWLGFGITPSRTRCYAFGDRVGPLLDTLNRQVLGSAPGAGLTTARRGPLDGTRIAADASRHRSSNLSRRERRLAELDRVIAADKAGQDPGAIPAWMARSPATRREQRYRFRAAQKKLLKPHAQDARRSRDRRQEPEKIVLGPSDLEAASGRDQEKVSRPLYNLPVVHDPESPLILGYGVFAQATDAGTMMPLRQRVRDLGGVWIERLLADAG